MALGHSPKVVTDGLVFYYDMNNSKKSWIGRPTTNHIASSSIIHRYNNTGFSGASTNTGLTYKGAPIYELTFIPQDASFISRLGSTEGFGAFHTMGIPLQGNTTYMASIYMRSDHPLQAVSTEGFSNGYSNIGGWTQNSTVSTRYKEDGWTRLYSQFLNNQNGYATRNLAFPDQYGNGTQFTVNTTSTQIIDLSVTVPASGVGIRDFDFFYAIVAASPAITVNGGLTGLTILDHGLDTTSYTKLSWPSNIRLKAQLPFTYYFRVSVPSTSGANVNINIASNFTSYTTAITDSKFWKVTFDTTNVAVGQVLKTYWCCPMLEQHNTLYPSTYVNGLRSSTQVVLDMVGNNTITASSLTYNTSGTFSFDGSSNVIAANSPAMPAEDFTIELVVYPTNFSNTPIVICPQNAGIDQFIQFNTNGTFIFKMAAGGDTGERSFVSSASCTLNSYNHIVCVKNGVNIGLYLNGILTGSSSGDTTATAGWGSTTWSIGQRGNATFYFSGLIPEIKAYNRGLTAQEVRDNFNATRGRYGL
jgi:hypothetical protein